MKMLPLLITFILIECSVGAPPLDCASELDGYKELVKAKAALKSSLVEALLGKHLQHIQYEINMTNSNLRT